MNWTNITPILFRLTLLTLNFFMLNNRAGPGEVQSSACSPKDVINNGMQAAAKISTAAAVSVTSAAFLSALPTAARAAGKKTWEKVQLDIKDTLFDITFDPSKPEHGWVVGSKGTFLETFDGGDTWLTRTFNSLDEDEDITYRFEVASLKDNEGWIIGKPAIMLHTRDGGKQFERIPVSPKLPGEPISIKATGPSQAEMITSQGAVYTTVNGGLNWKAQVKETIDATLNRVSSSGTSGASFFTGKIQNQIRDANGNYIAVGSRGNLFLTWQPGQEYWVPHNRGSSRRIQNMGFIQDDAKKGVWMTLNGGSLLKTKSNPDLNEVEMETLFESSKINSGGYGIIDVTWKGNNTHNTQTRSHFHSFSNFTTPIYLNLTYPNPLQTTKLPDENNVWAVGGSGIIFESNDGKRTPEHTNQYTLLYIP